MTDVSINFVAFFMALYPAMALYMMTIMTADSRPADECLTVGDNQQGCSNGENVSDLNSERRVIKTITHISFRQPDFQFPWWVREKCY